MDKPATRVCNRCGIEKPLDRAHFTPAAGYRWGLRPTCKACRNTAISARRLADPEYAERYRAAKRGQWARWTPVQRASPAGLATG